MCSSLLCILGVRCEYFIMLELVSSIEKLLGVGRMVCFSVVFLVKMLCSVSLGCRLSIMLRLVRLRLVFSISIFWFWVVRVVVRLVVMKVLLMLFLLFVIVRVWVLGCVGCGGGGVGVVGFGVVFMGCFVVF